MKKLNLQLDSIKEMLTKEQMKKIVGGYGSGPNLCTSECAKDSDCSGPYSHCRSANCGPGDPTIVMFCGL